MRIVDILDELENTASKLDKEEILSDNASNKVLVKILKWTYNKQLNFYAKQIPEPTEVGKRSIDNPKDFKVVEDLLSRLSARSVRGHDALNEIEVLLNGFDEESQEIIENILGRNLNVGISSSTINKALPNTIPTFDVALAYPYDKKTAKHVTFDGSWLVSRKLDGCRCIVMKKGNGFLFFSRKGKPFYTLDNLIPELQKLRIGGDFVLDGEICIMDENGDEDFQSIMKLIRKKDYTIENPMFKVFDVLTEDEFDNKAGNTNLSARLATLKSAFKGKSFKTISFLEQEKLTEKSFARLQDESAKKGWEGLMLRKDSGYKGKRSNDLLKVKKFYDAEYKVLDIETGPFQHTIKGQGQEITECMTNVIIEHKGERVSVGSGFTIEQRVNCYHDPKLIVGKMITVQYFEESRNKEGKVSLRFPTCKWIHGTKREV